MTCRILIHLWFISQQILFYPPAYNICKPRKKSGGDQQNYNVKHQIAISLIQGNCVLIPKGQVPVLSFSAPRLNLRSCGQVIQAF